MPEMKPTYEATRRRETEAIDSGMAISFEDALKRFGGFREAIAAGCTPMQEHAGLYLTACGTDAAGWPLRDAP